MKRRKLEKELLDAMSRELNNWKGPFYVNRKDPRLIVPKYSRWMGWTFNFGNPYAWPALIALIVIIILLGTYTG